MDVAARHQGYPANIYAPHYQVGEGGGGQTGAHRAPLGFPVISCSAPSLRDALVVYVAAAGLLSFVTCVLHIFHMRVLSCVHARLRVEMLSESLRVIQLSFSFRNH